MALRAKKPKEPTRDRTLLRAKRDERRQERERERERQREREREREREIGRETIEKPARRKRRNLEKRKSSAERDIRLVVVTCSSRQQRVKIARERGDSLEKQARNVQAISRRKPRAPSPANNNIRPRGLSFSPSRDFATASEQQHTESTQRENDKFGSTRWIGGTRRSREIGRRISWRTMTMVVKRVASGNRRTSSTRGLD